LINPSGNPIPLLRFEEYSALWKLQKLNSIAEIKRGAGSQYIKYVSNPRNGIRLIRIGDFLGSEPVFVEDTRDMKRFRLMKGDILIAGTGATAGITFLVPDNFIDHAFSYNAPRIRVINDSANYLVQYLKSNLVLRQQQSLFTGLAQPFLDMRAIGGFKIHLPTLPEQQKIAAFLSAVDTKIQQLQRKKELLEQYKKGVMQKIFSQEIRFKNEDGNDYPDWEERSLGDVGDVSKLAGYEFTKHILYESKGEIIALRGLNIKNNSLDLSNVKYIDNSELGKLGRSKLYIDDLMFTYIGTIGEVALIKEDNRFYLAPNVSRIRLNKDIANPLFVIQHFNLPRFKQREVKKYISSSSQPALTMGNVRKFLIHLPTLEEQNKIASYLGTVDKCANLIGKQIGGINHFKKGLLQQMFI